jgi:hypothetical protein
MCLSLEAKAISLVLLETLIRVDLALKSNRHREMLKQRVNETCFGNKKGNKNLIS